MAKSSNIETHNAHKDMYATVQLRILNQ